MPRGVRNVQARLPYLSVVPLAVATGALSTVSSPTIAQSRLSCRETISRNPDERSAMFFADAQATLSARFRKRRSEEAATTIDSESRDGDVSCEASVTVRLGDSSATAEPECWAEAQDGKKARTNSASFFIGSCCGFVVAMT